MIAQSAAGTRDLLWAAVITASLGFLGAFITALIAYMNHRQERRIDEQVQPENGMRLGSMIEQTSKTVEAIDGRVHENSKRTDRLEKTVDRTEIKLDEHISDTAPLVLRAKRDWGPDGEGGLDG